MASAENRPEGYNLEMAVMEIHRNQSLCLKIIIIIIIDLTSSCAIY